MAANLTSEHGIQYQIKMHNYHLSFSYLQVIHDLDKVKEYLRQPSWQIEFDMEDALS